MGTQGWRFGDAPGCIPDTVNGFDYLHQVYTLARHDYTGRVTVPVQFDKHTRTIINNESAELIEMLNSAFDAIGDASLDFFPAALRAEKDRLYAEIYECVNNGVCRAGFATMQEAYEEAFDALFTTLDKVDARLAQRRYLLGARIT